MSDVNARKAPQMVIERPGEGPEPEDTPTAPGPSTEEGGATAGVAGNAGRFQDATIGFIEGVGRRAWAYADAHPHTVLYSAVGLVLAVLILVVGLWHTLVIAIFMGVGAAIGQMRDGEGGMYGFFSRIFGGRR